MQKTISINKSKINLSDIMKSKHKIENNIDKQINEQKQLNKQQRLDDMINMRAEKEQKQIEKHTRQAEKEAQKIAQQEKKKKEKEQKEIEQKNEVDEKQKLILIICRYMDSKRFEHVIKDKLKMKFTEAQLQKKKINALRDIHSRIKTNLNNKSNDMIFDLMVKNGCMMYESIINSMYECKGVGKQLQTNDEFLDLVEMFRCEYSVVPNIDPSIRLALCVAGCTYITHTMNMYEKRKQEIRSIKNVDSNTNKNDVSESRKDESIKTYTLGNKI